MLLTSSTLVAACLWLCVLALPWRPWGTGERLHATKRETEPDLAKITVLIPARNEAECITRTLKAVFAQGRVARVVVIDDQSDDGTGRIARCLEADNLIVVDGSDPPPGWTGKLWALEQGLSHVESEIVLLLDADIELAEGMLATAAAYMRDQRRDMVSLMAALHMESVWERMLLPPFVYFFKLIYPFSLANCDASTRAAAAGGFVLVKTRLLHSIGGFAALRGALIDDCTLAHHIKSAGGRIWIGLTRDARAIRPYHSLSNIWNMVARTAYTQLRYSPWLLFLCTVMLLLAFVVPLMGLFADSGLVKIIALGGLGAMGASYLPTLRYYERSGLWAITLPVAAVLYLAMTWTSAYRYVRGQRSNWKNRMYARDIVL